MLVSEYSFKLHTNNKDTCCQDDTRPSILGIKDSPRPSRTRQCMLLPFCQPWLEKDVSTERTSREMLLNILIGNYELSSKENLLVVKNQNLLGRSKKKFLNFIPSSQSIDGTYILITNKRKIQSVFVLFSIVCSS